MKKAHFFNGRSRLGIINNPYHQKENNFGVEYGGDKILSFEFISEFETKVNSYVFPLPENIKASDYFDVFKNSIVEFKKLINNNLKPDEKQIVIGGDHIVTLSSVLALIERTKAPDKIGYIHFDSHGDINSFAESPTGNFHGMYLRPLFDEFDIPQVEKLVKKKIPKENSLFIGNLKLDEGELKYFALNKIQTISTMDLKKEKAKTLKKLSDFVNSFEYLHVSFDGDVLDKSVFPATGIPGEDGLLLPDTLKMLEIISTHPKLSFDFAEFNPLKSGSDKSLKIAQDILRKVI